MTDEEILAAYDKLMSDFWRHRYTTRKAARTIIKEMLTLMKESAGYSNFLLHKSTLKFLESVGRPCRCSKLITDVIMEHFIYDSEQWSISRIQLCKTCGGYTDV